jgi:hypothetical protein
MLSLKEVSRSEVLGLRHEPILVGGHNSAQNPSASRPVASQVPLQMSSDWSCAHLHEHMSRVNVLNADLWSVPFSPWCPWSSRHQVPGMMLLESRNVRCWVLSTNQWLLWSVNLMYHVFGKSNKNFLNSKVSFKQRSQNFLPLHLKDEGS